MSQVGNEVVQRNAPKFTNYVVVDGTWNEEDITEQLRTDDGDSKVHNYTSGQKRLRATCDVMLKADQTELEVNDVLAESSPGTRSWVVVPTPKVSSFGGRPLKQSLTLEWSDGFTPTVVT